MIANNSHFPSLPLQNLYFTGEMDKQQILFDSTMRKSKQYGEKEGGEGRRCYSLPKFHLSHLFSLLKEPCLKGDTNLITPEEATGYSPGPRR